VSLAETARESDSLSLPELYQSLLKTKQLKDNLIMRKIKKHLDTEGVSQLYQVQG
jgi:hypothetical protein